MLYVSDVTASGRILIAETHPNEVAKRKEFIDNIVAWHRCPPPPLNYIAKCVDGYALLVFHVYTHIYGYIPEALNARQPLVDRVGRHAACVRTRAGMTDRL